MNIDRLPTAAERALRREGRGRLYLDDVWRAAYATDGSHYMIMPLGVFVPRDADDVALAVSLANEHDFPLIMRGAGTGLAGETLGRALIVDTTRHLNNVRVIDPGSKTVRVEAGRVLDSLNTTLAPHGLKFGPDPSSSSRAVMGALVANNSTGAHSLVYGHTRHHVRAMDVVLSDGTQTRFESRPLDGVPTGDSLEARIYSETARLIRDNADLIEAKRPKTKRDRAGYLLYNVLDGDTINLAQLMSPSEGTLAAITSIDLDVHSIPRAVGFAVLSFPSYVAAAWAVRQALEHSPAAVELLDEMALNCIRLAGKGDLLPSNAKAVLFVEFYGESDAEITHRIETLEAAMRRADADQRFEITTPRDAAQAAAIWAVRKSVEPMQHRMGWKNGTAPCGFIEDAAVDPFRLGEYMEGLCRIMGNHAREWGMYGHAGAGLLHTRVFLDLSRTDHRDEMQAIAEEVFDLVVGMDGTISGEHGTGLARTQFVPRQYGELFPVLEEIKRVFDPGNVLNPGKVVGNDDPELMKKNVRKQSPSDASKAQAKSAPSALFHWEGAVGWLDAASHCTGCGECRTPSRVGRMCPSFKDSPDELRCTRARANVMRLIARGEVSADAMLAPEFRDAADYCLDCKMCTVFCPVAVDGGKLMAEARAQVVARRGLRKGAKLFTSSEALSRLACSVAPIANGVNALAPVRLLMEKFADYDHRRMIPAFCGKPFLSSLKAPRITYGNVERVVSIEPEGWKEGDRSVAYFVDQFANFNDPSVAHAFVEVMNANGIRVLVPPQRASAMPAIDYGDVMTAKRVIAETLAQLAPFACDGVPIVCTEPTAALALSKEYADLDDSQATKEVADATREATDFLRELRDADALNTSFRELPYRFGYHTPCHLQQFEFGRPGMELLSIIPGVSVELIDQGCCGLAGAFGFGPEQFVLSQTIARPIASSLQSDAFTHGATECSLCRMQLEQASGREMVHPIKVLAEAYRG